MGRGMGGDMGFGITPPASPAPQAQTAEQELEMLKANSQVLAEQVAEIQRRIDGLEKKKK